MKNFWKRCFLATFEAISWTAECGLKERTYEKRKSVYDIIPTQKIANFHHLGIIGNKMLTLCCIILCDNVRL